MPNELLLLINVVLVYGAVLLFFRLFGSTGLTCFTVFATIAANIEVLILVNAFGMEQTLGNILFASNFLVTDILSENYGKKRARQTVNIGIAVSLLFIAVSQLWLRFTPSPNDFIMPSMRAVFSNTPRVMLAGFAVYAVCQHLDVWLYEKWWNLSKKMSGGDSRRFLWLRNNGSTLVSQLINSVLFTFGAFLFTYDINTLIQITLSSYVIFVAAALLDTPFVYLARKMKEKMQLD